MRSSALTSTLRDANFNSFRFFLVATIHASVIFNNDPPLGHETQSWKCLRSHEPHVFTPTVRDLEQLIVMLAFSRTTSLSMLNYKPMFHRSSLSPAPGSAWKTFGPVLSAVRRNQRVNVLENYVGLSQTTVHRVLKKKV
jgi:hypothetical protein